LEKIISQIRIDSLNDVAWEYAGRDLDSFYYHGNSGLVASNDMDYLYGRCMSLQIIGSYHIKKGNLDSALIYLNEALNSREEFGDSSLISGTLNNIGAVFERKGDNQNALLYYLDALEILPADQLIKKAKRYDNLGIVYNKLGQYADALNNNTKAFEIFENEAPFSLDFAKCKLNRGNIYGSMKDLENSLDMYQSAGNMFDSLDAKFYLGKAKNNVGNIYLAQGKLNLAINQYGAALNDYRKLELEREKAGSFINLGHAYRRNLNFVQSESYYDSSLVYWKSISNFQKQAEVYIARGNLFLDTEKYSEALENFLMADKISSDNAYIKSNIYFGIMKANFGLKQYNNAIAYQDKFHFLEDSLEQIYIDLRNFQSDLDKMKLRNEILERDQDLNSEKARKSVIVRNALLVGILLSLASLILLYLNWRGRKKRLMLEKNALKKQRRIDLLLKDQELTSIRSFLEIQEKERRRIAKDLHDRLGSLLSVIKLHFQRTNQNIEQLKSENLKEYKKANKLLDEACDEVRKIAHDLDSGLLKNFGLIAAIEDLTSTLNKSGEIDVELVVHNFDDRLPSDYEVTIYRIVQELVANILKHAEASEIAFQFLKKEDSLHITVEDNGKGFDADWRGATGMGLNNINSRLLSLNGIMHIDSHIGRGTSVFIEIPIEYD